MSLIITFMFDPAKLQMYCASASGASSLRVETERRATSTGRTHHGRGNRSRTRGARGVGNHGAARPVTGWASPGPGESQPPPGGRGGREPRRRAALLFGHLDGLVRGLLRRGASELRSGCSALPPSGRMGAVRTATAVCATFPPRSQVGSGVSAVVDRVAGLSDEGWLRPAVRALSFMLP